MYSSQPKGRTTESPGGLWQNHYKRNCSAIRQAASSCQLQCHTPEVDQKTTETQQVTLAQQPSGACQQQGHAPSRYTSTLLPLPSLLQPDFPP